jgi:hypothetical protein
VDEIQPRLDFLLGVAKTIVPIRTAIYRKSEKYRGLFHFCNNADSLLFLMQILMVRKLKIAVKSA